MHSRIHRHTCMLLLIVNRSTYHLLIYSPTHLLTITHLLSTHSPTHLGYRAAPARGPYADPYATAGSMYPDVYGQAGRNLPNPPHSTSSHHPIAPCPSHLPVSIHTSYHSIILSMYPLILSIHHIFLPTNL